MSPSASFKTDEFFDVIEKEKTEFPRKRRIEKVAISKKLVPENFLGVKA